MTIPLQSNNKSTRLPESLVTFLRYVFKKDSDMAIKIIELLGPGVIRARQQGFLIKKLNTYPNKYYEIMKKLYSLGLLERVLEKEGGIPVVHIKLSDKFIVLQKKLIKDWQDFKYGRYDLVTRFLEEKNEQKQEVK